MAFMWNNEDEKLYFQVLSLMTEGYADSSKTYVTPLQT